MRDISVLRPCRTDRIFPIRVSPPRFTSFLPAEQQPLKSKTALADKVFAMNTKLLLLGAIVFSFVASKTGDLLFTFFAVYLTALGISVFFFKREQKRYRKPQTNNSAPQPTNKTSPTAKWISSHRVRLTGAPFPMPYQGLNYGHFCLRWRYLS